MYFFRLIITLLCSFSFIFMSCKNANHLNSQSKLNDDNNSTFKEIKDKNLTVTFKMHQDHNVNEGFLFENGITYGNAINSFIKKYNHIGNFKDYEYFIYIKNPTTDQVFENSLGKTILLSNQITQDTIIYIRPSVLPFIDFKLKVDMPLNAYLNDQPWPPCINFYGYEPINKGIIGVVHAFSKEEKDDDNHPKNMIILSFGKESKDRVAYNKNTFIRSNGLNFNTPLRIEEPFFHKILYSDDLKKIVNSSGYFEVIEINENFETNDEFFNKFFNS